GPPGASSASIRTPSADWPGSPGSMPTTLMTSSWLFPPRTTEVQFDEKWSFVGKKQKNCDPLKPEDDHKGDWWDHVAYDPAHKLVLAVVPGARATESVEEVVAEVKGRVGERPPALMTSDEYPAYESVIAGAFSAAAAPEPAGPGPRRLLPERRPDPDLRYATVHKERERDRVVAVHRRVVLGSAEAVERALKASVCSRTINTSFVERQHATDRGRNARKARKTYRFSKDWRGPGGRGYFTMYNDKFYRSMRRVAQSPEGGRGEGGAPAR